MIACFGWASKMHSGLRKHRWKNTEPPYSWSKALCGYDFCLVLTRVFCLHNLCFTRLLLTSLGQSMWKMLNIFHHWTEIPPPKRISAEVIFDRLKWFDGSDTIWNIFSIFVLNVFSSVFTRERTASCRLTRATCIVIAMKRLQFVRDLRRRCINLWCVDIIKRRSHVARPRREQNKLQLAADIKTHSTFCYVARHEPTSTLLAVPRTCSNMTATRRAWACVNAA